jgi:hypothetical protein
VRIGGNQRPKVVALQADRWPPRMIFLLPIQMDWQQAGRSKIPSRVSS